MGINPTGFEWRLENGESFQTPEAALAALDARLSELETCLKEVQSWQP